MNWLPIKTAPKDGTPILVGAEGHRAVMVRWTNDRWQYPFTLRALKAYPPTHWMPLPAPPASISNSSVASSPGDKARVRLQAPSPADAGNLSVSPGSLHGETAATSLQFHQQQAVAADNFRGVS